MSGEFVKMSRELEKRSDNIWKHVKTYHQGTLFEPDVELMILLHSHRPEILAVVEAAYNDGNMEDIPDELQHALDALDKKASTL